MARRSSSRSSGEIRGQSALILEAGGPEALPVLGRALARRVQALLPKRCSLFGGEPLRLVPLTFRWTTKAIFGVCGRWWRWIASSGGEGPGVPGAGQAHGQTQEV